MKKNDFFGENEWKNIMDCARVIPTPFIIYNKERIFENYRNLSESFHFGKIYYAVKANPHRDIIELLNSEGSSFDIASVYELDDLLNLGVTPDRISFGNTIKKGRDVEYAYTRGVKDFVTDSDQDLENIAKYAPNANVNIRLSVEGGQTAEWPLSTKFGCHPDIAFDLVEKGLELGLNMIGVSFHVGSQQLDIGAWDEAISKVKYIFDYANQEYNHQMKRICIGGGFPTNYKSRTNDMSVYASEILRFLEEDFSDSIPEIWLEPGRALAGDAGVLVSEVVLISRKSRTALNRWIYCDAGKFNGLIETLEESIKYPIFTEYESSDCEEVILAGPTCDSMDIMYQDYKYRLPMELKEGDLLYWLSTGAYTESYSSVFFNGFPPVKGYIVSTFKEDIISQINLNEA